MIYTSYFAKSSKLPKDTLPISIACKSPLGWRGISLLALAPTPTILKNYKTNQDIGQYKKQYNREILSKLKPDAVVQQLDAIARYTGKSSVCLFCWEGADKFCHRHLVAEWLQEAGYTVVEYQQ